MLPIKLELHNFLAYRAPDPVRFDGVHLACLTGSNGAGKSSLLDAITWALWGKARARRDEDLIHIGQHDMYVQLDFEQEGTIYRVLRQRTRKSGSTGTLELFSLDADGTPNTLSEPNMRATQVKINRLLRLDYETFTHSAFLQQGKADAFTVKTAQERKKILTEILGLLRWEQYEELAKAEVRQIDEDIRIFEGSLRMIAEELAREPHLRAELAAAETAQHEAQVALEIAEKSLAEVATARAELAAAQSDLAQIAIRITERQRDLTAAEGEVTRHRERIAQYEQIIARRAEIESGYLALQDARSADELLGDLLMQLTQLESRESTLRLALAEARGQLERGLSAYQADLQSLQTTIDHARPADLEELQQEVASLHVLDQQRERLQETMQSLEQERASLEATNKALKVEMDKLKERLDRLEKVEDSNCPLCGQPLTADHRQSVLEELSAEGRGRGDTWRANKARVEQIKTDVTAHKTELTQLSDTIKRLPTLQESIGVLQAGVEAASAAGIRLQSAQSQADALRQQIDAEDYGHDIRAELAELAQQRAELGYSQDAHNAARDSLQAYREYEAQHRKLEMALDGLPDVQAALENAQARVERLQQSIADEQAGYEQRQIAIAGLEVKAQEQRQREDEVRIQRAGLNKASVKLGSARQELQALDAQRKRQIEIEARRMARREERLIYDDLREAFGKKGIPAMIIEAAIPELESSANRLLSRMTDGRMQLKLETQREKISGGVAETLDVHIADELGTRSYELYSGGEAFRINFALRVALSQLLARRAGAHLRTLFIDEGFGTQDEDGRNKLVEAITAIQDDFDLILVVTHMDDLRDSFPVHLVVNKTTEGSYVSLR